VSVTNNTIYLTFVRPALGVYAQSSASADFDTVNCIVDNNIVVGNTPFYQFQIFEGGASVVSGLQLVGNRFDSLASQNQIIIPRGWAHFTNRASNNVLDTRAVNMPDGATQPEVWFGNGSYITTNTAPTSITDFTKAGDNQEITVKLNNQTTIVYNSSLIRLKGNVNVVGTSSDQIISLRRFSNIWFEVSRSF